uniref:retropepsin-like aspartic protease family protein n=1 Tax=Altererythrobacter segetis TaxID=1104773 RepID=UPI00140B6344|nr:TIGR02281 family clan AA aspartic protease [Altererythrobacter segetis]
MKGFVVSVLALGAMVAFLAPRGEHAAASVEPVHADAGSEAHLAAATGWGGEMVLDRESDGHFYATVDVGGSDYRMLVDTGATMIALTGDDARGMGLDWDPNALAPVARGASGPVMGVPVTIPDLAIGDFDAHNVEAVIVPEGLAVSLLGQSFLSHVPKVAISDDKMTLSN